MSQTLHLYGTDSDLSKIAGDAGLLCEFPDNSEGLRAAECCYDPHELLGPADAALSVAHAVVSKLLRALLSTEELPILSIFEEPFLEQVSYAVQAFHLDQWISSHGFSTCNFHGYSPWLDRLQRVRSLTGSRYELIAQVSFAESSWLRRGMGRLLKSRKRPAEVFRRLAPLVSRHISAAQIRTLVGQAPRGGIWFYSTGYNFTKIGLEYESYFPEPLHFLVEDPASGGRCLTERRRRFYPLYAWSRAADIPPRSQVRAVARRIGAALASVPLSHEEDRLRTVLLQSSFWDHFLRRRLPFVVFHERVVRRWCDDIHPEMLVVGNAGWERALLQSPEAKNVPSVMLQHGVMHWVYTVADQPVTVFLLRGRFFQRHINETLRRKTVICNYPQQNHTTVEAPDNLRRGLLFITTPYEAAPLFHPAELREILTRLLRASDACRRCLIIRVHPSERISFYQQLVRELQDKSGVHADVAYSQGPGVEDVLARSCVAVLYFSTMFLDCLRHGIPVISFAWHWFPNKRHYEEENIFNFAKDLDHLEELVHKGIAGELSSRRHGLEAFLAATKPEEISQLLQGLWQSRKVEDAVVPHSLAANSAD
ncbi:MAG TPA: hypothetical protein VMT53_05160 [Terriglobales bacterium]|nr:hypothetical protein [Terriglobales bacterium]